MALPLCCGGVRCVVLCCVVLCCFEWCCAAFGCVLCLGTRFFALSCGVVWLLVVTWCVREIVLCHVSLPCLV